MQSHLESASEDRANSVVIRRKHADLHERFTNHKFILYLLFLRAVLPTLAVANKSCQERGMRIREL